MSRSVKALINPEMLIWARKTSSLSLEIAARKLKQKEDTIRLWEEGKTAPTFKQLLKICQVYKRPVPLFYLEKPPEGFKPLEDYRRLPGAGSLKESPNLNYEIRKAWYRRQVALDLYEELGEKPSEVTKKISLESDPEEIGVKLREWFGLGMATQTGWKDDYMAFNTWRDIIEKKGILVFQAEGIDVDEMRGFALSDHPLPVIVVNKKDSVRGRIFSMLHELAHILLGDSSISDSSIDGEDLSPKKKRIEIFCNHVAAATLLPSEGFRTDEVLSGYSHASSWDDSSVETVAQRFKVSREFIWRRLLTMNVIPEKTYQKKRQALIEEFRTKKETEKKKSIPVKYHHKLFSTLGSFYTGLVVSTYHQNLISASAVSDYLGMKLKHLPEIEAKLYGPH